MNFFGRKHVALAMALMMSFSSIGNPESFKGNGLVPDSYSYVLKDESIDMASNGDASEEETSENYTDTSVSDYNASPSDASEEETLEMNSDILRGKKPDSTGAEATGIYFLAGKNAPPTLLATNPDEFYDVTGYLNTHRIIVDGSEYNHTDKLNPSKSFELYLDFKLSRADLKANGLKYKYKLPENITIGDIGTEDEQWNLYNEKGQTIGTYYIEDDVIYITFPGYYDNVIAFFSLGAHWRNVDNLASVDVHWTDGDERILFDLSQITVAKNISKFTYEDDIAFAEFSVIVRPSDENLGINGLIFNDKFSSPQLKLYDGLYDEGGVKKDICLEIYSADNTRVSQDYYTFAEAGVASGSSSTKEMTIPGITIPKGGYAEVKYGIMADKKTLLKMDAQGTQAGYVNIAKGTYDITDSNGQTITTAETETRKEGSLDPRTDWIFKTMEDAQKKDDDSAVIVPYTIGINRNRLYSLGGSVVKDEITNYEDDGTVIYDFEQTPYVSIYDGTEEKEVNLKWVKLDKTLYDDLKNNLYKANEKTAMENLLNGTSDAIKSIRSRLCTKLGVSTLTNENISECIFTSDDVKNFLWFVPLDTKPTYYLLHYYTTADLSDMGSQNAAKMMYTEIEGYPRGPGLGWMNPYKKVLEISKENYGIYEDGNGNYYVDWHIAVTVPKNSHFDHIMLSDDLQRMDLNDNPNIHRDYVSDSQFAGYYVDWFPAAPDISYAVINNESRSVEQTAQYEWAISDQIFSVSSADYSDPDIANVVDNLKGVFSETINTTDSRDYGLTYPDEHATFETSYFSHVSSYQGRTYVSPPLYMEGSYFQYLYSGRTYDRGQYVGDSLYRGWSYTYEPYHYTWSPGAVRYYIKELPKKDFTYTIDINYTTQINPELMKALPNYCENQELMTLTNTVRAYQGVKNDNGEYIYNPNKEIAMAEASYYMSKKDVQANILKKVVGYDKDSKTVSYAIEINPNASVQASKTTYELKDIISYSGVKFNPDSLTLMDDSGSEPGVDGKVIWSNGGKPVDSSYQSGSRNVSITLNNSDSGASDILMRFDNSTGFFGESGEQFKHMYLVYTVDASNWNEADILSNSVYLYNEKTVPNGTDTYTEYVGSDTSEFVGTDALSKTVVGEPTIDNNFTATFEVVIDTNSSEAGDLMGISAGESFTVHDEMSDNLTLDPASVKVEKYDSTDKSWKELDTAVTYPEPDNYTLDVDITVPNDAAKFRITYDAIVKPYKSMQIIENEVSVKDHSVAKVNFEKKVYTRNNNSGADAEAYKINLKKSDSEDPSILLGASFELYYYDEETKTWIERPNGESSDGLYSTNPTSGIITLSNALCGSDPTPVIADKTWYKLVEVKAPEGYILRDKPIYYYVSAIGVSPDKRPTDVGEKDFVTVSVGAGEPYPLSVTNSKLAFDIRKTEASSEDIALPGAEFKLYSDEACTNELQTANEVQRGIYRFSGIDIGNGTAAFYLKETKAPADYTKDDKVYKVTVENSQLKSIVSVDGTVTLTKSEKDGKYIFNNESDNGSLILMKNLKGIPSIVEKYADEDFMFKVEILDVDGNPYIEGGNDRAFPTVKTLQDGTTETGVYYSNDIVYLKNGESIVISGIPSGSKYTATELKDARFETVYDIYESENGRQYTSYNNVVNDTIDQGNYDRVRFNNTAKCSISIVKQNENASDPMTQLELPDGLTFRITGPYSTSDNYVVAVWDKDAQKFNATELKDGLEFDNSISNGFTVNNVPEGKFRIYESGEDINGYSCEWSSANSNDTVTDTYIIPYTGATSGSVKTVTVVNTYTTSCDAPVEIRKRVTGHVVKADDYSFELYDTKGTLDDKSDDTLVETATNNDLGRIIFNKLKYEAAGEHDYYVIEKIPSGAEKLADGTYKYAGTIYDNSQIDVHVSVNSDASGKLSSDVTYSKDGTALTDENDIYFANSYAAEGELKLTGTKSLVGVNMKDDQFTFLADITRTDSEGTTTVATAAEIGKSKANGDISFSGEYTDGTGAVAGDYLKFTAKDAGATFTYDIYEKVPASGDADYVQGMTYSTKHYTVTAEVTDNRDGTLKVRKTVIDPDDAAAEPDSLDFENKYKAEAQFKLKADKILNGRQLAANQFSFEVLDRDDNNNVVATGKNNASGDITFNPIKFYIDSENTAAPSNLGTHHYTVREVTPDTNGNGYTYDRSSYNITVTARDAGNGTISISVSGCSYDDTTDTYKINPTGSKAAAFVNNYTATGTLDINIKKTLKGRNMIADNEAVFFGQIYQIDSSGQETALTSDFVYAYTKQDGSVVVPTPFTLDQRYAGSKFAFYLREATPDNGLLPSGNVMQGITYSDQVYRIEISVTDNGDGTLTLDKKITDADNKAATELDFVNIYKAEGTISFTADKLLKGREIEDKQFTFDILENGRAVATGTNDANGQIVFSDIRYYIDGDDSYVGTHNYIVKEHIPSPVPSGYKYDNTEYQVKVEATDNQDGTLNIKVTGADLAAGGVSYTITKPDTAEATFVNNYEATGVIKLEGTKELHGRAENDGEFEFSAVEYKVEGGSDVKTGREFTGRNDANGGITFDDIEFKRNASVDERGIYKYVISENKGQLGGITYDTAEYSLLAVVSDNADGTLKIDKTLTDKDGVLANELKFSNEYDAEETLSIEADKTLKGRVLEDKQFTFEIYEGDTLVATGNNDAAGKIKFSGLRFYIDGDDSYMGEHDYTVKEVVPATVPAGYKYDQSSYDMKVIATDNGDGTIKLDVSGEGEKASFVNEYAAEGKFTIEAEKILNGRDLYKDEFSFKAVEYKMDGGKPVETGKVLTATNTDAGKITFDTVTYKKNEADGDNTGDYIYKVTEVVPTKGHPGVTYDESEFTVNVNVTDSGLGKLDVTSEILDADNKAAESIRFTNNYKAEGIFTLKADKALTGTALQDGQFTFDIYEGDKLVSSGTNDADGNIKFDDVRFFIDGTDSYVGEHKFTVKERIPDVPAGGYTYDEDTYEITITATDDEKGTIELNVTGAEADDKDSSYILKKKDSKDAAFVNIYEASADVIFEGTKSVENLDKDIQNRELQAGDYRFTLEEYKEQDKLFDVISEVDNDADGSFAFEKIHYELSDVGTHYYRISEVKGNKNYVIYTEEPVYAVVTLSDAGDGTLIADIKYFKAESIEDVIGGKGSAVTDVAFINKLTSTFIAKTDPAGKQLENAELSILDSSGKTVYSFVTDEEKAEVYGLERGMTYTLRETKAPDGFQVASDVYFKLDNEGKLYVADGNNWVEATEITMVDNKVVVGTSKTSVGTGDVTALWLLFSLLGISLIGITVILKKRKK